MNDSEIASKRITQEQVEQQLDRIAAEFLVDVEARFHSLPWVDFDPKWPSKCIQSRQVKAVESEPMDAGLVEGSVRDELGLGAKVQPSYEQETAFWKPIIRNGSVDLSGLESALELKFPPEFRWFFSHFWSASIPVMWDDKEFELLQLWNLEDEENLRHNLLGHVFETRRVRQSATLFFALVDDQRFLSLEISSGKVFLEEVGGQRPQEVAKNLLELLSELIGKAHQASG